MDRTRRQPVQFLLITPCPLRAGLIEQHLRIAGAEARIRRMDPGADALACARQSGRYRGEPAPDAVLLDFTAPDAGTTGLVAKLKSRDAGTRAPLILLTTPDSEANLSLAPLELDMGRIFAPTDLACFAANLARRSRTRFCRALGVLAMLGPILVRLPAEVAAADETGAAPALSAAAGL